MDDLSSELAIAWEDHSAADPTTDAAASYANNTQFFIRIVESALGQGHPMATVNGTSTHADPSGTFLPGPYSPYADYEQISTLSPDPSPCYLNNYNMYIRDLSPEPCVDPAAVSSPSTGFQSPLSPASSLPSLYYFSESSPEVESPIQSVALLQHTPVAADPTLPVEESVLSQVYRSVGATLVASTPSQFPTTLIASSSVRKTAHTRRKAVSSTSRQARQPTSPPPRNVQSPLDPRNCSLIYEDGVYRCPVAGCQYVLPSSRRRLDVRRHFETHRNGENKKRWQCCGVPLDRAHEYGITDVSGAYLWRGCWLVGGCQKGFSRRDSLGRHLEKQDCVGHMDMADYLRQMGLVEEA